MTSKKVQTFAQNVKSLVGCSTISLGLLFATSGIYEFHTGKNLFPTETINKMPKVYDYIATHLDEMPVNRKLNSGAVLIFFGLAVLSNFSAKKTLEI